MTHEIMNRYLSTPPVFSSPVTSIDREKGIIQGVTICQVGPAKGHGGFIDKTFLLQIVEDASTKSAGIKSRFGHPNMCSTAMGTYLGRFKNYSYSGSQVKADLHLDDTAKTTPNGDLFTYVLDMAEKNPDMFGASIAFEIAESVFLQEVIEGKKIENEYFRLKELRATDIVDDPAATNGLFSSKLRTRALSGAEGYAGIATQFLDENPQILDLIFSKPDSIKEFLSNYINNSQMSISETIKQNFTAFLASFSANPSDHSDDDLVDTLFDAFSSANSEILSNGKDYSTIEKAEVLTDFFSSATLQLKLSSDKLTETITAFDSLNSDHQALLSELEISRNSLNEANASIQELTEKLSARPSIPLNVTDPQIDSLMHPADKAGKDLLSHMPIDQRRHFEKNSEITE